MLSHGLGLRHAVDADHVAAIDNVTRKPMRLGTRPASGGFFFACGHSAFVILAVAATTTLTGQFDAWEAIAGTDAILMLRAYGWVFVKPVRKLSYSMAITLVSVVVAVLIGGIEALGLIGGRFEMSGWFCNGIGALNDHFNTLGLAVIGVSIAAWIVSALIYRYRGYDAIEAGALPGRAGEG